MLQQLNAAIARYVHEVAERRGWQEFESKQYSNFGASRDYHAGNLHLRVMNDRGLVDLEVGAVSQPRSLRSASFYRDLLDPPALGVWNLGIGDQTKFVDDKWDVLQEMLAPDSWQATLDQIDTVSRRSGGAC
jgi:hypothetical protein